MFDLKKILNGRMNVPEPEAHIAGVAITPGMALTLSGGKLTKCAATAVPTHISIGSAAADEKVAVYAVDSAQIFEAELSVAPGDIAEGNKVTIGADALTVTATTTGGVATVVSMNGAAAAGDKIVVKF